MKLKLTVGKVVDTANPDTNGTIKVRSLPEHKDVTDDLLPWAIPFFGGYTSDTHVKLDTFNVGDMLWIVYDDNGMFNPCYYIPMFSLPDSFNFTALTDRLENVVDLEEFEYGQVFIELLDNGDIYFRNNANKDSVFLKNINTYIYFKGTGEVFIHTPETEVNFTNDMLTVNISTDGTMKVNNEKFTLEMNVDGDLKFTNENTALSLDNAGNLSYDNGTAIIGATSTGDITFDNGSATVALASSGDIAVESPSASLNVTSAGMVEVNGNVKNFVTHLELDTALQTFIAMLNVQMTTISTGATAAISAGGFWTTPLVTLGNFQLNIASSKTPMVTTG